MDLKSTFSEYSTVTQITFFKGGNKLTHTNLDPKSIKEGTFTKIWCNKGYHVCFNRENIDCFEIHPETNE